MILYTIKLKLAENDSDSDGGMKIVKNSDCYKFWFIKEIKLNLNYSII